jgi:hypothetical protein
LVPGGSHRQDGASTCIGSQPLAHRRLSDWLGRCSQSSVNKDTRSDLGQVTLGNRGADLMERRRFMFGTTGLLSLWPISRVVVALENNSTSRQASIDGWQRRIQSLLDRDRLPIIDVEATYVPGKTNVARMIKYMEALDVAQIAFAPAFAASSKPSLDLHRAYPEYFIPTTNSAEFPRWWQDPMTFLAGVGQDLQSGSYPWMGEHEFRHYPSPEQVRTGQTNRDISIDLSGPAGHALFQLSEQFGVPFQLHYEIEDRLLAPLEAMLERYPKAKAIWCHLAMIRYPERAKRYHPDYIAHLIERFPGIHFDLAVPAPDNVYRPSGARDSTLFTNERLDERWQQVIETHPERFLAASDYRPAVEDQYPAQISRQRQLILEALSERTRHLVAYANAWRLITGTPWPR